MRFRKFGPIDREYPIYELIDGDAVLLDVSKNDEGIIEVAFHEALKDRVIEWDALDHILAEGHALAARDDTASRERVSSMKWQFEYVQDQLMLSSGDYGLQLSGAELEQLKTAAQENIGALRRVLDEIAGRQQRDPRKGRAALADAFTKDGRTITEILKEISAALP
jgi:hypothetical protein